MKVFSSKKRVAAIGAATAIALVGGGTAFAYWTSSGTGTGGATTGTSSDFAVSITQTSFDPLAPGDGVQDFDVTVTNPGDGVLRLSDASVAVKSGWAVGSGANACDSNDFTVSAVTKKGTNADISGAATTELDPNETWTGTFTVIMNNLSSPQDLCKGLVFDADIPDSGVPLVASAS